MNLSSSVTAPNEPQATYRDDKRHWWWLPLFVAISPVLGIYLTHVTHQSAWLWMLGLMPLRKTRHWACRSESARLTRQVRAALAAMP